MVETVQVVARLVARRGMEQEAAGVLEGLIEPTRAEGGCLRYELFQSTEDPRDFVFVEEYAGPDALDAHMKSRHVQAVLEKVDQLFEVPPEIRTYRKRR
jgi:quinol monooxygenase YgiN